MQAARILVDGQSDLVLDYGIPPEAGDVKPGCRVPVSYTHLRWVGEAFGTKWGFLAIWLQWIESTIWFPTVLTFACLLYTSRCV